MPKDERTDLEVIAAALRNIQEVLVDAAHWQNHDDLHVLIGELEQRVDDRAAYAERLKSDAQ